MSADDVRHRAPSATGEASRVLGRRRTPASVGGSHAPPHAVASRVPAEYREAYLDGFARTRARRDRTVA